MRKILILAIPAILALSACNGGPRKNENNNIFLEDTLAHEEIFGNVELDERSLQPQRLAAPDLGVRSLDDPDPDPVDHPNGEAAIGVQSKVEGGMISYRFVAPIRLAEGDISTTTAIWTRTISTSELVADTAYKPTDTYTCQKVYTALSAGGGVYTIEQYNTAHSLTGDAAYTHFAVYCVRDIPNTSAYKDYYLCAYLELKQNAVTTYSTKALATSVDGDKQFTFETGDNGGAFFIVGTFSSAEKCIPASRIRYNGNHAEFDHLDFSDGDKFVIHEFFNTTHLVHYSSECILYEGNSVISQSFEDDGDHWITVKDDQYGNYTLYLNGANRLYKEDNNPYDRPTDFYVKGTFNDWSVNDNYKLYSTRSGDIGASHLITLHKGDQFKVYKKWDDNPDHDGWYGWNGGISGPFKDTGGNIEYTGEDDAQYYIGLNGSYSAWVGTTRVY